MSEDWHTKYGTRRVRRDPPTLEEAIFAAVGITEDHEQQAEIAAALMGMPIEPVLAEVKKTSAPLPHGLPPASSPANRARSARSWSSAASSGASATTSAPAPDDFLQTIDQSKGHPLIGEWLFCISGWSGGAAPAIHPQQHPPIGAVDVADRAGGIDRRRERSSRCELRLILLGQIDGPGGFAVAEGQMRAKLVGERPHRLIAGAGGDPQDLVALGARLRDQLAGTG